MVTQELTKINPPEGANSETWEIVGVWRGAGVGCTGEEVCGSLEVIKTRSRSYLGNTNRGLQRNVGEGWPLRQWR